jgi:hypothetical protein
MPELIRCTACGRQLQLPESLIGQAVQCPSCQATFVASVGGHAPPPPAAYQPPTAPGYPPAPEPRRPPRDDHGRDPHRRDEYGYPDDYDQHGPRGYRRPGGYGGAPHRGGAVLTLGILSLVFSLCPIVGFILGIIALTQGSSDLTAMDSGHMDPEGRGSTVAGRTCGLIGLILSGVFFLLGMMRLMARGIR